MMRGISAGLGLLLVAGASWSMAEEPGATPTGMVLGPKQAIEHQAKSLTAPSVQVDERGTIHLAWMQEDKREGKEVRSVRYARGQAGGPLGPSVVVNRPEEVPYGRQEAPALAVNGDEVFITWALTHPKLSPDKPFSSELRLSRSADGGRSFLPSVLVNDDNQVMTHSFDSLHLGHDGVLHIAWIDGREGKKDPGTFVARSPDQGHTVTKNLKLDDNTCVCCRTSMATGPDGTLYVAWRKIMDGGVRETVVARSTDGGQTFSPPVVVGNDRWVYLGCPHRPASIGVDRQGRLYVAWYTEGEDETPAVYVAMSDDQGRTFSPKRALNVSKGTFPDHPQMAVDGAGRIVAVWEEQSPVRREVVVSYSLDRGRTFSRPQKLNDKKGQSPTVSMNEQGFAALAWMEHAMTGHKMILQTLQLPDGRVTQQLSN